VEEGSVSELSLEEKATEAEHNTIILLLAQYKLSEAKQIVQSMMNSPINPEPLRNMLRSTSRSIISIQKKLSEVHI
jgi:hypothetical protein